MPEKSLPYEKEYWRQDVDDTVELCYSTTGSVSYHLEFDKKEWFTIDCIERLLKEAGYTKVD